MWLGVSLRGSSSGADGEWAGRLPVWRLASNHYPRLRQCLSPGDAGSQWRGGRFFWQPCRAGMFLEANPFPYRWSECFTRIYSHLKSATPQLLMVTANLCGHRLPRAPVSLGRAAPISGWAGRVWPFMAGSITRAPSLLQP